jgi:SAM-dependent methyltransferase
MSLVETLKRLPIDVGQGNLRAITKGKMIARRMVPHANGHQLALDVGCREGIQTRWLRGRGYQVISVDIERVYDGCLLADADRGLPFRSDRFDVVWCSEVIEHLRDPAGAIKEFRRVARPGGRLVLTTPNSDFWLYTVLRLFGKSPRDVQNSTHRHFFGLSDIQQLFPEARILGYFPYAVLKMEIESAPLVAHLSPTFVVFEDICGD